MTFLVLRRLVRSAEGLAGRVARGTGSEDRDDGACPGATPLQQLHRPSTATIGYARIASSTCAAVWATKPPYFWPGLRVRRSIGPLIEIGSTEEEARDWTIEVRITRGDEEVFRGDTSVSRIKRTFTELGTYLFRSQTFPHGAVLLTGTGIIPSDDFTLQSADVIRIEVSGIGSLENSVVVV